ncbi:PilZ domain-containing protein [Sphingobium sp. WCS2017Hpa-17]|uniref:PilZ domain-containing protein n=1 Tax=Sphingobium sp. WCS2017Hpa-17 TaxID=3073638 RepID=UPI00288B63A9|nr:PilZ domain-containing protein [Sphingobium sp. WCS2017Hpa-17]
MTDRAGITALGMRPRSAARHKLFEPLAIRHGGLSCRAHMLDLSVGGALLHADHPPPVGAAVLIEGPELTAGAHIVWTRGKRFGIRFDMPLCDRALQSMLDRGIA